MLLLRHRRLLRKYIGMAVERGSSIGSSDYLTRNRKEISNGEDKE
jgi:hypothetical protein